MTGCCFWDEYTIKNLNIPNLTGLSPIRVTYSKVFSYITIIAT